MIELYPKFIAVEYQGKTLRFSNINSLSNYLCDNGDLEQQILEIDYKEIKVYDRQQALNFFRWYYDNDGLEQCNSCNYFTAEATECLVNGYYHYECNNCGANYYED